MQRGYGKGSYHAKPRHKRGLRRLLLKLLLVVLVALVVVNGVMWIMYRGKVLPNVSLGNLPLGNSSYGEIDKRVAEGALLAQNITLQTPATSVQSETGVLGVQVDVSASIEKLKRQRTAFPLLSLVRHVVVPVELAVDQQVYDNAVAKLSKQLYTEPLPERVAFVGEAFTIVEPEPGYEVQESFANALLDGLRTGQTQLVVATTTLQPPTGDANLNALQQKLNQQLATKVTYVNNGQKKEIMAQDKGQWYARDGQSMKPVQQRIEKYVTSTYAGASNAPDVALATLYALTTKHDTQVVVTGENTQVQLTYCTNARGVDESKLTDFTWRVAAILADPRGWNLDGAISFQYGSVDCDFIVWLSAPSSMTSFGAICDEYYSCRVGEDVVINYDRWTTATDPWNQAGMSIADYQALVVNHEAGHALGFGHPACPGNGQPAPVMMQQSIELGGCKFNPWPTQDELNTLKAAHGVSAILSPRA